MLKDEVNSPDHATKLKEAGLSGKQLQLKLGILKGHGRSLKIQALQKF